MKNLGRTFNHLEDLTFFYGSAGAFEAVQHLRELQQDSSSLRMKWDGGLQIYWGRESINGPLIFTGHNGWSRGVKSSSGDDLFRFVAYDSGNTNLTADQYADRIIFAAAFASLYEYFDEATPNDFVGFVYGDALYTEKQLSNNGNFDLYPNGKTGYHIREDSELGKRISDSSCMVVAHAYFPEFGMGDDQQIPNSDFSSFGSQHVIVLNPYYASSPISIDTESIDRYIVANKDVIDDFLLPIERVSAFKNYIYRYTNAKAKQKQLSSLGDDFIEWLEKSNISVNQRQKIINRVEESPNAVEIMFKIVKYIMNLKNSVIDQLVCNPIDISTTNSEGWVRYADITKQFGNVKFVPRHKWLP